MEDDIKEFRFRYMEEDFYIKTSTKGLIIFAEWFEENFPNSKVSYKKDLNDN